MITRLKQLRDWLSEPLPFIYLCNITAGALGGVGFALWNQFSFGLWMGAGWMAAMGYQHMQFYSGRLRLIDERQWEAEMDRAAQRVADQIKREIAEVQGVESVEVTAVERLDDPGNTTRH